MMTSTFELPKTLPKLIVFDLDYTLWPFWVDTHITPPVSKTKCGRVTDAAGRRVSAYPETTQVLQTLYKADVKLAVASRTPCPELAEQILNLLDWNMYFAYKEIYPGSKIPHFRKLNKKSGVDFSEMIFFDDEQRNVRDVGSLGVTCIYVKDGMSVKLVQDALNSYSNKFKF